MRRCSSQAMHLFPLSMRTDDCLLTVIFFYIHADSAPSVLRANHLDIVDSFSADFMRLKHFLVRHSTGSYFHCSKTLNIVFNSILYEWLIKLFPLSYVTFLNNITVLCGVFIFIIKAALFAQVFHITDGSVFSLACQQEVYQHQDTAAAQPTMTHHCLVALSPCQIAETTSIDKI